MSNRSGPIAILLVALIFSYACAQRPVGRGRPWSTLDLDRAFVGYRSVRNELGLTESQIELLTAFDRDLDAQSQPGFPRRRRGPGRANRLKDSRTIFQAFLEPKQVERLAEINLQFRGLYAIDDQEFAEDLKLSEEQLSAVVAARKGNREFDMSKLKDLVGLEKAKVWWTALGYPFRFSGELQDLRTRYRERQQLRRFRRP